MLILRAKLSDGRLLSFEYSKLQVNKPRLCRTTCPEPPKCHTIVIPAQQIKLITSDEIWIDSNPRGSDL